MARKKKNGEEATPETIVKALGQFADRENCESMEELMTRVFESGGAMEYDNGSRKKQKVQLSSMQMHTLSDFSIDSMANLTSEDITRAASGAGGIKQQFNASDLYNKRIEDSIDRNDFLVYVAGEKPIPPGKRCVKVLRDKAGKPDIIAKAGQACIVKARIEGNLPLEEAVELYTAASVRRMADEAGVESGEELMWYHAKAQEEAREITAGKGTHEEKSRKLWRKTRNLWKKIYESRGYEFPSGHFGRDIAVKIFFDDQSGFGSMEREGALKGFAHPNVLPLYLMGKTKTGLEFTAMPFVDSKNRICADFNDTDDVYKMCRISDVLDIIEQACDGVEAVNAEKGIVHRDLKPENLFITYENSRFYVRIADFGMASTPETRERSRTGKVRGTPKYFSPEQTFDSKRANIQSDLYSLGLIAYEWISGKRVSPEGEDSNQIAMRLRKLVAGERTYKPLAPSEVKDAETTAELLENSAQGRYGGFFGKWKLDNDRSEIDRRFYANIVDNELRDNDYSGLFGGMRLRRDRKKAMRQFRGLELVLAKMMITQNAKPLWNEFQKNPRYIAKMAQYGELCYEDLDNGGEKSDMNRFIDAIRGLRYSSISELKKDIQLVRNGKIPRTPDYTQEVFRYSSLPLPGPKFLQMPGKQRIAGWAAASAAAAGLAGAAASSGLMQKGIDWAYNFFTNFSN